MAQKLRTGIAAFFLFAVFMSVVLGGHGDFGLYAIYILASAILLLWPRIKAVASRLRRPKRAVSNSQTAQAVEVEPSETPEATQKIEDQREEEPRKAPTAVEKYRARLAIRRHNEKLKSAERPKPAQRTARSYGEQARYGEQFPLGVCGLLPLITLAGSSSTCWIFPEDEVFQLFPVLDTVNGVMAEVSALLETSQFEPIRMFWTTPDMRPREEAVEDDSDDAWWHFTRVEYNPVNEEGRPMPYPVKLRFFSDMTPWAPYSYWGFIHYTPSGDPKRVEVNAYLDYYGYKIGASMVKGEELRVRRIDQFTANGDAVEVYRK